MNQLIKGATAFLMGMGGMVAQDYFPTNTEVKTVPNTLHAFTNASIHVDSKTLYNNATLLIQNDRILAVGTNVEIPSNAVVHSLEGKHIYPGFVELHSNFGISSPKAAPSRGRSAQYTADREGYYWNDHIQSTYDPTSDFSFDTKQAANLRKMGFGLVNTHRKSGIHRGTSLLVAPAENSTNAYRIRQTGVAEHYSFQKSKASRQSYPSSVMGAIALLRQLHADAKWYAQGNVTSTDLSLEALKKQKNLSKIFETKNTLNTIRAARLGKELGLDFAVLSDGRAYEHLSELKKIRPTLIVPIDFPKSYPVDDPLLAEKINLNQLRYWNQAPSNLSQLAQNNISFAITSNGHTSAAAFFKHLRTAVAYGLSKEKALQALTQTPAKILGITDAGHLRKGAVANFLITNGDLFSPGTELLENWVIGTPDRIKKDLESSIDGKYQLRLAGNQYEIELKNSATKLKASVSKDSLKLSSKASYANGWLSISFFEEKQTAQLSAKIQPTSKNIRGKALQMDGQQVEFTLKPLAATSSDSTKKEKKKELKTHPVVPTTYPNNAFGWKTLPKQADILFRNATVWTNESEGIIEQADVQVKNGKIVAVGKQLNAEGYTVIDASGKHLTSGVIDEHSHIGASSINEGGQNSSAEVSIADVLDPTDIDLYRNLSGGVTTIQILHGSANPIGGRSAIIKLRWGQESDGLLYKKAKPFIKFALGENVKQSNWQSYSRFPQTRMGVEQVYVDYFTRAQEYGQAWKAYRQLNKRQKAQTNPPRYDYEMEVLWEILQGKRFISCHSYVQSEINMLMKVAEQFGFRVNTFTHILEGYKVADKMKTHGVGGSTFSDWWAYKYEVNDAIPFNAAIMHQAGVVVAINSDDAEMSRRLNQEAAKAVKYGGISEEDAWKFVTLNPAKLLRIDDHVGSIKAGKDADLVLWSDHPLSVYAKAEKTMIDGIFYYEADRVQSQMQAAQQEKQMLMQQMLDTQAGGERPKAPIQKKKREFHCETLD
ncbi:MAG: amidohydrolase family protein [Flavobacteriaceae bacterium]